MFVGIPKGGIFFIVPKFTPIVGFVAFGSCRKNNGEQWRTREPQRTTEKMHQFRKNKEKQTHPNTPKHKPHTKTYRNLSTNWR